MLVTIEALGSVVFLEAIAFEIPEQGWFDGDLVLSNDEALTFADGLVGLIPGMLLDLRRCQTFVRVSFQDFVYQVNAISRQTLRHLKLTA